MTEFAAVAVVVIGRNEGERLKGCLRSIQSQCDGPVVYVDSGSTDGSADYARSVGVDTVDLDLSRPFTMARGRNTGFDFVVERHPTCQFVQFVDGDCEMIAGWINSGLSFLQAHEQFDAVCGNRVERFPMETRYNQLINMEWQGHPGDVDACGGDAMYRVAKVAEAGRFNESMIAGEEAELCLRLRQLGARLMRLDSPMTLHDANMQHFSQWWMRSVRCGYAYAQGYDLHGGQYKRKPLLSAIAYGIVVPALMLLLLALLVFSASLGFDRWFCVVAVGFLLSLYFRIGCAAFRAKEGAGNSFKQRVLYGFFIALGKFPEAQGVLRYVINRLTGKMSKIIEYKKD